MRTYVVDGRLSYQGFLFSVVAREFGMVWRGTGNYPATFAYVYRDKWKE